jgi:hypothetical protein
MLSKRTPINTIAIADDGATLVEMVMRNNSKVSNAGKKVKKAKGAKVLADDKENQPPRVQSRTLKPFAAKDPEVPICLEAPLIQGETLR